jgi:hypothetical protein
MNTHFPGWKVAVSIPDEVNGCFSSDLILPAALWALELPQPLTVMTTMRSEG